MADAVTVTKLMQGQDKMQLVLTNISDGTGESNVVKLDISTILDQVGLPCVRAGILDVQHSIQGFSSVRFSWDHTVDDQSLVLAPGNGYQCFDVSPWLDPQSAGGTGDLLLTTAGAAAGATYNITLTIALRFQ